MLDLLGELLLPVSFGGLSGFLGFPKLRLTEPLQPLTLVPAAASSAAARAGASAGLRAYAVDQLGSLEPYTERDRGQQEMIATPLVEPGDRQRRTRLLGGEGVGWRERDAHFICPDWFDTLATAEDVEQDGSLQAADASAQVFRIRGKSANTRGPTVPRSAPGAPSVRHMVYAPARFGARCRGVHRVRTGRQTARHQHDRHTPGHDPLPA